MQCIYAVIKMIDLTMSKFTMFSPLVILINHGTYIYGPSLCDDIIGNSAYFPFIIKKEVIIQRCFFFSFGRIILAYLSAFPSCSGQKWSMQYKKTWNVWLSRQTEMVSFSLWNMQNEILGVKIFTQHKLLFIYSFFLTRWQQCFLNQV